MKIGKVKLTVVTVVYNAVDLIESTILSVLGQSFINDIEYIIIDGGSSDGTLDILKKYSDKVARIISEKDKGIYDGMNKGINAGTGEWIIFMNAGDTFVAATTVEDVFKSYQVFKDSLIVFGDVNLVGENSIQVLDQGKKKVKYESICHQSQFINLHELKKHAYNCELKIFGDYEYQLKVFKIDPKKIFYVAIIVANYNIYGVSTRPFYKMFKEYVSVIDHNIPLTKRIGFYNYGIVSSFKSWIVELLNK